MHNRVFYKERNNNRLVWADALRGVLILLVILGHCLQFGDYEHCVAWNIIYSFHMAAFFVVSGYVSYRPNHSLTLIPKRAKQLLLPWFCWSILRLCVISSSISIGGLLKSMIIYPDSSYWFLYVLFVIIVINELLLFLSDKLKKNPDYCLLMGVIILIILMVLTELRYLGFQFISLYFGFYVLGRFLNKYHITFHWKIVTILGVLWLTLAIFWRMHEIPVPLKFLTVIPDSLIIYAYRYITAFIGSLFFLGFAMLYMNSKSSNVLNILSYLGKISLGLYIIHLFLGLWIDPWLINVCPSDISSLFVLSRFVIKLLASVALIQIIQRIPYISLLLLGKGAR